MGNLRTEKIAQRVTPLVEKLLALEQKSNGGTLGDALERLIVRGSKSEAATALICQEALKNPQLAPFAEALSENAKLRKSK